MRFFNRIIFALLATVALLSSCAQTDSESFDKYEDIALKAWIAKYRPELIGNLQTDGGYYIDIEAAGEPKGVLVSDTICWVSFDFTGRDLSGNIIVSRVEQDAKQTDNFSVYTHYVPYYRYCGEFSNMPVEGTHLAMRNKLTLGQDYFEANKAKLGIDKPEFQLREGTLITLYMPSRVVGSGFSGDGGYQGQFSLDANKPLIVKMKVGSVVKNPVEAEGGQVDVFAREGGGLRLYDTESSKRPISQDHADHPYNITEKWVNANDTIPHLYVNYRFAPTELLNFPQATQYKSGYAPYNNFTKLEKDISEALVKRFHKDEAYEGVKSAGDSVKLEGKSKLWYIGRFTDGYIFDTNIDEVKELVYGEVRSKGTVLEYTPKDGEMIKAFYYTVPTLRYGQWATLITASTHGYGSSGKNGGTTSSSSGDSGYGSYMDYMNMYNYSNGYYGNSGSYGGYYGGYYGNYMNGMYGQGYGNGYNSSQTGQTTTTTVQTEIPPFATLIFEIYVEPLSE